MISWQEKLKQIFNSKVKLEAEELSALLDKWDRHVELNRNDFLIRKGETESSLFFVLSGSMRIFFPHQEDEICVGFAHTDNLICSYPSFILNKPSDYYIQALSKTELVAINRADFYLLLDSYRNIERAWRMLEEDALLGKIEREVEMLTFTPEERYHRLIRRSPHIFQIIPRKYIASYLRMTPETLSRIRPSG
jgi:CRP-like cAMP-binding protein